MLGAMGDITKIKKAQAELGDRGNQLNVLYDLASAVNRADSLHVIYDRALDAILTTLRADRTSILLFDERGVMQFQAWRGLSETYRGAVAGHSPWKRGETGTMPIVVEDVAASDIDPALKTVILDEGIRAMAFVPLTSSGRIIGKFMVYFERSWTLDKEDLGVAQGIADLLGTGIERKRTERALRESEQRLRAIMDYAPAAIFIKDPAGRYLFMNEQCARELNVNREQALGNTDRDLLSAELAAQFMANDQRVWASGSLLTAEEQVPQADGVHTSLVQKFLLRDNQGLPYALSGIALDITPHLRLESAIQASEARLQLTQSAANIGVFDWDIAAQKGV
ncbi:PAS domain-containing protein, partial [Nitrospira sp. BLG_2]